MKTTKIKLSVALVICLMLSIFNSVNIFAQGDEKKEEPSIITRIVEEEDKAKKDVEIRYPNKLSAKQPPQDINAENGKNQSINKGVPSTPSNATAKLTENVNNANINYPVYNGSNQDVADKYFADARQFITFKTKTGKTFHLIINHDEEGENVMLLTEVSEDDLLNMVEAKEKPKEVVKEEPVKQEKTEEAKSEKKEETSSMGTYILLVLVTLGALGAGYYFKVVKKKEDKELESLEEDDDFFSEAEGTGEAENQGTEEKTDDVEEDEE